MAKEKSIRQQVMEAGFGEMLESYNFTRVSATHYKKEEDFGIWRVALGKGTNTSHPDSFRDGTGFQIRGLDEIWLDYIARANIKRNPPIIMRSSLPGTNIMVHWESYLLGYLRRTDPGPPFYPPPPPPPKGFWQKIFGTARASSVQPFWDHHPDVRQVSGYNNAVWHLTQDRPIAAFSEELCGYWQRFYPDIVRYGQYLEDNQTKWRDQLLDYDYYVSIKWAMHCWVAGDKALVRDTHQKCRAFFSQTDEQIFEHNFPLYLKYNTHVTTPIEERKANTMEIIQSYRRIFSQFTILMEVLEDHL